MAASYGSGLPVEFAGDPAQALEQYGPRIINQVDVESGRVRPSASLDAEFSVILSKTDRQQVRVQANAITQVVNASGPAAFVLCDTTDRHAIDPHHYG